MGPTPKPIPMLISNRLAERSHLKHVHQAMEHQFKEMGMTSIIFVSYIQGDGKLVIDM
jgi:hypothetical protein